MGLFNRLLGVKPDPAPEIMTDEDKFAEQIANDINTEFEKWIKPELAKFIGDKAVDKLADADFDAVLKSQMHRLFLKHGTTVKGKSATFHFKLCQRDAKDPAKFKILSKFKYEMQFEKPEPTGL